MGDTSPSGSADQLHFPHGQSNDLSQRLLKGHRGPKSKTGCTNCKARRIKCDETKPNCRNCITKVLECTYAPRKPSTSRSAPRQNGQAKMSPVSPATTIHESSFSSVGSTTRHDAPESLSGRFSMPHASPLQYLSPQNSSVDRRVGHLGPLASSSESSPADSTSLLTRDGNTSKQFTYSKELQSCLEMGSISEEELKLTRVFFQTSTHLFSIYTGPCNPFMRLRQYLPHSKSLRLAVQAMAALTISDYQSADQAHHMDRGLELQRLAYRELSLVLADPVASLSDATFAAIVHIGMTEPWHSLRSDQSGAMHLRTSKVLICQRQQARKPLPPKYLCNLLMYWDLLVSLHSDSSHEGYSTDLLLTGLHSEDEPIDYIDPTLGVAMDLCVIIIDMENFLRFWRLQPKNVDDSHALEVALALERRLKSWQPELDITKLSGCLGVFQSCSLQDILFTAEAYRKTALLLLYRSVPKILLYTDTIIHESSPMFLEHLASSIMRLLGSIELSSPVCTTHEWVLFVTAPDVVASSERQLVRERMSGLLEKIGIIGIKEVMNYIEELWTSIDNGQADSSMWMDGMHRRNWYPLLG